MGLDLRSSMVEDYLSKLFGSRAEIREIRPLGVEKKLGGGLKEIKGFGYGIPYLIDLEVGGSMKSVVLETMRPSGGFGHDYPADRAQCLLLAHSTYNKLPRHVKSLDVGALTVGGSLKSIGDWTEFYILLEKVEGEEYSKDLERIAVSGSMTELDSARCKALSAYLAHIHAVRRSDPQLYRRRIRDLIGHGECIMGLIDSYPPNLDFVGEGELADIEARCVAWRWKIKNRHHRLCQVHGDFHPWNILFREGIDFTVLDRSRGEWGEPADDLAALSINYIFFSLQVYGALEGSFKDLFQKFIRGYLDETGDEEILEVVQPFFAWRALVLASPMWYPNLSLAVRRKILNFIHNILDIDRVDIGNINSYLRPP
ncbi:MAG: phosphotransferase [Candidatus Bathyarchaeia archaeon]